MGARSRWRGWKGGDFVDTDSQSEPLDEQDPWEPDGPLTQIQSDSAEELMDVEASPQAAIDADDLGTLYDLAEDERGADALGSTVWAEDTIDEASGWDEPEPMVDAVTELSDPLYPPDESITDLTLRLKIGEFLMRVEFVDDEGYGKCLELLKACGVRRLRYMLPWLRSREWRGEWLQLFLEFRRYWELGGNIRWWETFVWSEREHIWMPRYQRGTLTLDHAHQLIIMRSHHTALDVIDKDWLRDWDMYSPWELGVRSFANFALFRAGIPLADNWLRYLLREDHRGALEIEQCGDSTYSPFMLPSVIEQYGLPTSLPVETDPWPRATELVKEQSAWFEGDLTRVWHDVLSGRANV